MISPITIVIADDHPAITDGLRGLLETEPDLKVIGHASHAAEVVPRLRELQPDILLLDLKMPPELRATISARGGLDALAAVKRSGAITKAILFAGEMETQEIVEAVELGIRGLLLKSAATKLLIDCIRAVMSGACWGGTRPVANFDVLLIAMQKELEKRKFGLTPRELQISSAIVRHSMTNKDIAHFFDISEDTVKKHIGSTFDKLGVSNRLELDHFAHEHKLPLKDLF